MSDIASEAGVSQGTLYNYVESKEALFLLLVDRGLGDDVDLPEKLPLASPNARAIVQRVSEQVDDTFALPKLDAALARKRVTNARAELEGLVDELYERTFATREGADAIERSASAMPALADLFFMGVRRGLIERLTRYAHRRITTGHFRHGLEPSVVARFVLESVTFFARHRYHDPAPTTFDEARVRPSVIAMIVGALIAS